MKGEGSQILIYALTAVLGVLTLIFSYRAIASMTSSSDKILAQDFHTQLANDVDLDSSYGSVHTHTYRLPGTIQQICLINSEDPVDDLDPKTYPLIIDSWQSGSPNNVFIIPSDAQFRIRSFDLADGEGNPISHLCIPVQASLTLTMFGEGNRTRIEADHG